MLFLDYDKKVIIQDELFETVRTTQLSAIADSLNKGDLFVHDKLSIQQERAKEIWLQQYSKNQSVLFDATIQFVDIHQTPPGIAVSVQLQNEAKNAKQLTTRFDNVVIAERTVVKP